MDPVGKQLLGLCTRRLHPLLHETCGREESATRECADPRREETVCAWGWKYERAWDFRPLVIRFPSLLYSSVPKIQIEAVRLLHFSPAFPSCERF